MNYSSKNTISQQKADGPSDFLGITQSSGLDRHAVCCTSDVVGALCSGDEKGVDQYVDQGKCVMDLYTCEPAGDKDLPFLLIRRLTPLECERLQGFPDGWTDIPGASDSARYKALGNSVAIPCVDFVMKCMVDTIRESEGME